MNFLLLKKQQSDLKRQEAIDLFCLEKHLTKYTGKP